MVVSEEFIFFLKEYVLGIKIAIMSCFVGIV